MREALVSGQQTIIRKRVQRERKSGKPIPLANGAIESENGV